ncbi:unnamed protein product [Arabidopsis arenosa]|uniref:FBD domain-containing protein n=1 Tax=Arabidopsis arenosa TaxID=38785 RepID=A0A8S2B0G1_ARAAE|nr:unnamed protein product [Arabidopsis arenosa]
MVKCCKITDLPYQGSNMTWAGKRRSYTVESWLDRAMANDQWKANFPASEVIYLEMIESDHRLAIIKIRRTTEQGLRPFMFDTRLCSNPDVEDVIKTFYAFREAIPVLSKLFRLSITTDSRHYHWKLLPILLEKSPNLETLVIKGPLYTDRYVREYGLSCPVKVLKITEYEGTFEELEQMKHFLEKLPCLELVKVRASAINDKEKSRITKYLLLVPRSSNCDIQIKFL